MRRSASAAVPFSSLCSLLLFLFVISSKYCHGKVTVTCLQSPGKTPAGATCEGEYCMYAELPGIELPVRGCLSGDLLKSGIKSQCERSGSGPEKKDVCLCSSTGCNVNANGIKKEQTKLLRCYECEKNCSADTWCYGEYCTLIKHPNGKLVRGCSNPSMPLFERKGLGSCVTPSFPSHTDRRHWDTSTLRAITCTCNDINFCNGPILTKQIQKSPNTKRCRVRAYASTKLGTHPSPSVPDCQGEHCFNIEIKMGDVVSNVSGCMSFLRLDSKKGDKKPPQHEELNERGCMTITSETLRAKACFDTEERGGETEEEEGEGEGEETRARSQAPTEVNDEAPTSRNMDEAKNEKNGDKSRNVASSKAQALAKNRTPKERNTEEGADSSKTESEPAPEPTQPRPHFIRADEDPDNPVMKPESEGNTAIVAVFVAIMVLIVIAGVIWKFELHKKIFHARYQTVAG